MTECFEDAFDALHVLDLMRHQPQFAQKEHPDSEGDVLEKPQGTELIVADHTDFEDAAVTFDRIEERRMKREHVRHIGMYFIFTKTDLSHRIDNVGRFGVFRAARSARFARDTFQVPEELRSSSRRPICTISMIL